MHLWPGREKPSGVAAADKMETCVDWFLSIPSANSTARLLYTQHRLLLVEQHKSLSPSRPSAADYPCVTSIIETLGLCDYL